MIGAGLKVVNMRVNRYNLSPK